MKSGKTWNNLIDAVKWLLCVYGCGSKKEIRFDLCMLYLCGLGLLLSSLFYLQTMFYLLYFNKLYKGSHGMAIKISYKPNWPQLASLSNAVLV